MVAANTLLIGLESPDTAALVREHGIEPDRWCADRVEPVEEQPAGSGVPDRQCRLPLAPAPSSFVDVTPDGTLFFAIDDPLGDPVRPESMEGRNDPYSAQIDIKTTLWLPEVEIAAQPLANYL